ncbi:MAG: VWA domain-containing protein [Bacteroidota bacterium]
MTKIAAYLVGALLFCLASVYNFSILPKTQWTLFSKAELNPPPPPPPSLAPPPPPTVKSTTNRIQIALLLDTSNSMDGLIEQAKSQLWKMVNELADTQKDGEKPEIEIALYEYGNSNLNARHGYIRSVVPMTSDMDQVSEDLFGLNTNGGEEYCAWVIKDALSNLQWSAHTGDLKIIVIAGNESFRQGPINFREICQAAGQRHIIVNTIHCGEYAQGLELSWGEGAKLSGGEYMNINQDDKVVHIATPYDDKIVQLNNELNRTYIAYGANGEANAAKQLAQDSNAGTYGLSNVRERASFKSKKAYKNTAWDLVDAVEEAEIDLVEMEPSVLPEEMQSMTAEERQEYVEQKSEERAAIQEQIKILNEKAETYIAKQRREMSQQQTLDEVLIQRVLAQAKTKGFVKEEAGE